MGLFAGALEDRQVYSRPRTSLTDLVESASKKPKTKQLRLA